MTMTTSTVSIVDFDDNSTSQTMVATIVGFDTWGSGDGCYPQERLPVASGTITKVLSLCFAVNVY